MAKNELHPEKRDNVVAFKMTNTEKENLEAHCKKLDVDVSKYIRFVIINDMNQE